MLRAATRGSALALWQTNHVAELLAAAVANTTDAEAVHLEPVVVSTVGDRQSEVPISTIGGKGVFVKEVQAAVLDGRADIAVHSAKDLPAATPEGLVIAAVPKRADPRDVLVGCELSNLAKGAVVATGSARRRVQLQALRGDLNFVELRGNIGTRLAKATDYGAVVMAKAALDRLGEIPAVAEVLSPEVMVPQVGQGALAVECRADDEQTKELLAAIQDPVSRIQVDAERAFLATLGGDCTFPAGAYAQLQGLDVESSDDPLDLNQLQASSIRWEMRAVLADGVQGQCHLLAEQCVGDVTALGQRLAGRLLQAVA